MLCRSFRVNNLRLRRFIVSLTLLSVLAGPELPALAMEAQLSGPLPQPLPLFPANNWWNLNISNWPVDQNSSSYISFIKNWRHAPAPSRLRW
jgi:hypothetical protein